ncbi:MAG: hypothetical protein ABID63_16845 [Pseudomonadota bacterium]
MLRKLGKAAVVTAIMALVAHVQPASAVTAVIGSCYQGADLGGITSPPLSRELFVIVDQTLVFNQSIKEEAFQKILQFLSPGDAVHIIGFSANVSDRYTHIILSGQIDQRLADDSRYSIPKRSLQRLDACQKNQDIQVRQNTGKALIYAFSQASTDLPKTEILASLRTIANDVISKSDIPDKYVLLVSDMMENSELASFYGAGKLNKIATGPELDRLDAAGVFGDMQGARAYVIGGGYVSDGNYRPSTELKSLQDFWTAYFERSNGTMKLFGTPSLLGKIGD